MVMSVMKKILIRMCVAGVILQLAAAPAQAAETEDAIVLIDSRNCYEGMDKSYSEGYTPEIENDTLCLIVPVRTKNRLKDDTMKVALDLGSKEDTPFADQPVEKAFTLQNHKVNQGKEIVDGYLITFDIRLNSERKEGDYPVILSVWAEDESGHAVQEELCVNVKITAAPDEPLADTPSTEEPSTDTPSTDLTSTDEPSTDTPSTDVPSTGTLSTGAPSTDTPSTDVSSGDKTDNDALSGDDQKQAVVVDNTYGGGGSSSGETPTFAPKMIVQSCETSKDAILAGDEIDLDIILLNTSKTEKVRNMTVTVSEESEYLSLLSDTDTVYVDSVLAGKTCVASYTCKIQAAAPGGQYELSVAMDYADARGNAQSTVGKVRMTVGQPVRIQFDPLILDSEVQVADVVTAELQAMNLGRTKVHNVRAVIEADGLMPEGTLFIGDMEPGTTASGSVNVSVTGLSKGPALYGESKGTVTMFYEDEEGNGYEETMNFVTSIQSPFSDTPQEADDEPGQWWVIMAVIGSLLVLMLAGMTVRHLCRKRQQEEEA